NLENPNNIYVTTYNDVFQGLIHNPFANFLPLERIPFWVNRAFKTIEKLDNLFDEIIKKKHKTIAAGESNGDLLELMIRAYEDQNNPTLSDIELRDVQQKAREEVTKIIGDSLAPSSEQLKSLKYLNTVVYENLRMYPSVPVFAFRKLTEDLKCKNHVIPAGTTIGIYTYGLHHSPKLWKNPEKFIPERFENEYPENLGFYVRKYEISLAPNSIHKDGLKLKRMTEAFPIDLVFKRRNE
ncbi:8974_t:CDS:2, partial [Racocetra fulgida]